MLGIDIVLQGVQLAMPIVLVQQGSRTASHFLAVRVRDGLLTTHAAIFDHNGHMI